MSDTATGRRALVLFVPARRETACDLAVSRSSSACRARRVVRAGRSPGCPKRQMLTVLRRPRARRRCGGAGRRRSRCRERTAGGRGWPQQPI